MSRIQRLEYYLLAVRFWLKASELQRTRCLQTSLDSAAPRADLNFYVVAVQRICEVARQAADRAKVSDAAIALNVFDAAWPRFKTLRNNEEHITGPSKDQPPYGIYYFTDVVADLGPGGSVEFIVRVEETQQSVRTLVSSLESALSSELALLSAITQIVGRERRGRVSQVECSGGGSFDLRRRVNSTVRSLSLQPRRAAAVLQRTMTCDKWAKEWKRLYRWGRHQLR